MQQTAQRVKKARSAAEANLKLTLYKSLNRTLFFAKNSFVDSVVYMYTKANQAHVCNLKQNKYGNLQRFQN